jgi:hypothetical protein
MKSTLDESFYSYEVNLGSCVLTFNHSLRRDSVPLSASNLVNFFTVCLCQPLLLALGRHTPIDRKISCILAQKDLLQLFVILNPSLWFGLCTS